MINKIANFNAAKWSVWFRVFIRSFTESEIASLILSSPFGDAMSTIDDVNAVAGDASYVISYPTRDRVELTLYTCASHPELGGRLGLLSAVLWLDHEAKNPGRSPASVGLPVAVLVGLALRDSQHIPAGAVEALEDLAIGATPGEMSEPLAPVVVLGAGYVRYAQTAARLKSALTPPTRPSIAFLSLPTADPMDGALVDTLARVDREFDDFLGRFGRAP